MHYISVYFFSFKCLVFETYNYLSFNILISMTISLLYYRKRNFVRLINEDFRKPTKCCNFDYKKFKKSKAPKSLCDASGDKTGTGGSQIMEQF